MFSITRSTLAVALAATTLGASPALAISADDDLRGENAAAQSLPVAATGSDLRGEHAAGQAGAPAATGSDLRGEHAIAATDIATSPANDRRSPDARVPVGGSVGAQPVVVEVTDPTGSGFDWVAAIIGMGAGLALAVLAGVGVAGGRRRPTTV